MGNFHYRRFFILAIVLICLSFLPLIHCTNPQFKEAFIAKEIHRLPMKDQFYQLLREDQLNLNSDEEGQMKQLLKNYLNNDQHRRALAFHAMRGKRSAKLT